MYQACAICREPKEVHLRYGNLIICDNCYHENEELTKINMTPSAQSSRIEALNKSIIEARQIMNTVQIRTDIHNTDITAIMELKNTIDSDSSIVNKPYILAQELMSQYTHLKTVVFDLNQKLVETNSKQRAIQTYLNTLANSLRIEEREKLKIADINYKPNPIKITKVKSIGTNYTGTGPGSREKKVKLDKGLLGRYARELGISTFVLYQVAVQRKCTVELAAEHLKKIMAAE